MRVTSKGQVTIPVEVRQKAGLLPDTEVEFIVRGNTIIVRKAEKLSPRPSPAGDHARQGHHAPQYRRNHGTDPRPLRTGGADG